MKNKVQTTKIKCKESNENGQQCFHRVMRQLTYNLIYKFEADELVQDFLQVASSRLLGNQNRRRWDKPQRDRNKRKKYHHTVQPVVLSVDMLQ